MKKNLVSVHTMEYYSAFKKLHMSFVTWVNLDHITLSEINAETITIWPHKYWERGDIGQWVQTYS
jgi:hypothetical protein